MLSIKIINFENTSDNLTKDFEKLKRDFIRMISHEFKNPLTAIYSGSQYAIKIYKDLLNKYKDILPGDFLEYLELIKEGGKRIKDLIDKFISEN